MQLQVEAFSEQHGLDPKCVEKLGGAGDEIAGGLVEKGLRPNIKNPAAYVSRAVSNAKAQEQDQTWHAEGETWHAERAWHAEQDETKHTEQDETLYAEQDETWHEEGR